MRHAIIAAFAAAFAVTVFAVSPLRAQTAPPENLAAARELVNVMRATDQFKAVLPSIFQSLKPVLVQGRPEVEKDFDAVMPIIVAGAMQRLSHFADILANIYARNFTADELHDLVAFYRSPTGQKLIERRRSSRAKASRPASSSDRSW